MQAFIPWDQDRGAGMGCSPLGVSICSFDERLLDLLRCGGGYAVGDEVMQALVRADDSSACRCERDERFKALPSALP